MGILATAAFVIRSMYHRTNQKTLGQLFFGRYMILSINHIANWKKYVREKKHKWKRRFCKKSTRINYDSNIGDKSWSQGTRFINTKHHFKVRMNHPNVDKRNSYYTNRRTHSLNIHRIKPYNSLEIGWNTSIEIINIHIYTTYNVTSIRPYI